MKLVPVQQQAAPRPHHGARPPPLNMDHRLSTALFNPSDNFSLLWRYGITFPTTPTPTGAPAFSSTQPPPTLDFKTHLPASLATDPRLWSREDVVSFLRWCEYEFDLPHFDMDVFQMNGKALCLLTKADFGERSPGSGDLIHNVLQLLIRDCLSRSLSRHHRSGADSPLTPTFPLTPSWYLSNTSPSPSMGAIEFAPASGATVTLSPASSVDSQAGSPRQMDTPHPSTTAYPVLNNYGSSGQSNEGSTGSNGGSDSEGEGSSSTPLTPPWTLAPPAQPSPPPHSPRPHSAHKLGLAGGGGSSTPQQAFFPSDKQQASAGSGAPPPTTPTTPSQLFFPVDGGLSAVESNTNGRLLWDFLQQLLNDSLQRYTSFIAWKNRDVGVFKIVDPPGLARLWGIQKNHLSMNYDKMSRALRYYYRVNILRKVQGERHCYQFLRNPSELRSIKNISLLRQQMSNGGVTTQQHNLVQVKSEPVDSHCREEDELRPTDLSMCRTGEAALASILDQRFTVHETRQLHEESHANRTEPHFRSEEITMHLPSQSDKPSHERPSLPHQSMREELLTSRSRHHNAEPEVTSPPRSSKGPLHIQLKFRHEEISRPEDLTLTSHHSMHTQSPAMKEENLYT